jgi:hypothetical protein
MPFAGTVGGFLQPYPGEADRAAPSDGLEFSCLITTQEKRMRAIAALTLALSGAVVAVAAPAPNEFNDPAASPSLPQVETVQGVEVLNGGASLDEAAYLKSRAQEFPLQVLFSGRGGEYGVADRVTIRQGSQEVVTVSDAGPYLMAKLPPGRYKIEADFNGKVETRTVSVGQAAQRLNWNTPSASE